jgi:hypothetical protein
MDVLDPRSSNPADRAQRLSASMAAWEYLGLTLEEFAVRWRVGEYDGRALPPALQVWVATAGR